MTDYLVWHSRFTLVRIRLRSKCELRKAALALPLRVSWKGGCPRLPTMPYILRRQLFKPLQNSCQVVFSFWPAVFLAGHWIRGRKSRACGTSRRFKRGSCCTSRKGCGSPNTAGEFWWILGRRFTNALGHKCPHASLRRSCGGGQRLCSVRKQCRQVRRLNLTLMMEWGGVRGWAGQSITFLRFLIITIKRRTFIL